MACRGSVIALFLVGALLIQQIAAQGGCNAACSTLDDCSGELICIDGKCDDDPDVGTNICTGTGGGGGGGDCQPSGTITSSTITPEMCNTAELSECCVSGMTYDLYTCSPPLTPPATAGTLTLNGFGMGQSGGGAASCTGEFYSPSDMVVALSTGWFDNRSRCGKRIVINGNGKSAIATVVD